MGPRSPQGRVATLKFSWVGRTPGQQPTQSAILLSRCDFGETQREEGLTRYTEVCWLFGVDDGKHFGFAAARARGGGTGSLGIGRHRERVLQFTHLGGFKLESCIAIVADVVEATRRLAGVKNILRPTLRAGNGNWGKPHRPSEWRSATRAVKRDDIKRGPPQPSQ